MKKIILSIVLIGINTILNAQDINFESEYNKILWPVNSVHPFGGGITGDDGAYKRLALFHGHSIDLQTGNNSVDMNNSRLYIDSEGKIGLGTRNVVERVNVAGNLMFSSEYNKILWPVNSVHPFGGGITGDDGAYKRLTLFHGNSIDLQTGSNSANMNNSRLYIDSEGRIGIGTRTPDMKLTVKGSIHAEEVKIDLSVPAPDYVFAKDYNLKSIAEVEKYILKNSHLPEIPSAKEFAENGVLLAEMNMSLLKKIEELTLYTIQQQKEIEELKSMMDMLFSSKK